ncbi:hypothetical protein F2Q70_00021439 [Brassica cretica]|uniref:Uncharacterized protein n=2 Tax=Brassica cretica TaxID=69181 RepID=A0A3N6QYG2_BRACR|nr:hypothetical protein F2Q70_00021439 [Brassica cretica]KAF2560073.1 hypothetical protein F2Q68_00014990 [Brassica cretica]KAF3610299.1 hypothetical protein DY000_02047732 [Brassica cretica]
MKLPNHIFSYVFRAKLKYLSWNDDLPSSLEVGVEARYKFLVVGFILAAYRIRSEPSSFNFGGGTFLTGRFSEKGTFSKEFFIRLVLSSIEDQKFSI